MNGERWHTKEDILQDLAEATGRKIRDLDEDYLIVGERPPPHFLSNEDHKIQLSHQQTSDIAQEDGVGVPDLRGITEMLRMVKEHDDSAHDESFVTGKQFPSENINDIIVISKLNPNTIEFIPKSKSSSPVSKNNDSSINNAHTSNGTNIDIEIPITNGITNSVHVEKDTKYKNNGLMTENSNITNEINNMATLLKNKICEAAKSNKFHVKREKNVAIATLLKLYSKAPDTLCTDPKLADRHTDKTVKLCNPQFFENGKAKKDLDGDVTQQTTNLEGTAFTPNIDESLKLEDTEVNKFSKIKNEVENSMSVSDPEMKSSIEKVDKWLKNEPIVSKPKGPSIFLGPVAFKRKEPTANYMCPTELVNKKIPKPGQYIPSKYAEELGKKYMERNKEKAANMNIWTKLENDLKEKDRIIKNHLKESVEDKDNSSPSNCDDNS